MAAAEDDAPEAPPQEPARTARDLAPAELSSSQSAAAQATKEADSGSADVRRGQPLELAPFPLGAVVTAEHKVLVEAAASSLAELRSASARVSTDALLARSQHLDLSAERAWSTAYACSALDDAVACLERFRAALLELLGGSVPEGVLGDAERPLHIHLTTGVSDLGAGGLFCSAPERVLVARSIESAEVVMTAVALANWTAPSLVLAVPALPIAVRDLCVQVGFVGTARTAICDMPGTAPLSQSALTAEAFAARDDAAVTATAQRSLWVEFLEALVARFGIKRLVKLARFTDQLDGPDFTPAAAAAALEAGAPMCFEGAQSFSQLLQDWASQQWESVALDTPTEWVGGIGSHVTFDPTDGKTEKPQLEADAPVVPMTVLGCWRWMLHWLWTEKRTDLMWCVLAITWNCIWTVYGPVLLSDLIDETGFVAENGNADADALPHETSHGGLLPDFIITKHRTFIIALVACMAAGSAISVTLNRQLSIKTPCNPGFTLEIGSKLTQHISRLPQLFMDTANLPKLLNVMDEDIYLIGQAVSSSFTAVYCGLMLAASLGLMYTIERVLTSVLIGMLPLYGLIAATVGRQNGSMSMMYRREERGYKAFKEEVFFTSSVSRSLGQSAVLNGRLSGKAEDCLARADELSVHTATSQAMVASVSALFSTFLLGYGAWLMTSNRLSVGDWVAFYSAVQSALPLVPQLAEALRIWYGAQEALVLMRGIASLHREQFKNAAPLQTASIVLENVSFTFFPTPGPFVLVNVNAHCPSGSKIALCGRSGCGKSTLLRLLSRLYQPSSGRILVNGVCLNEVDIGSLISAVEQEVVLFNTSVKENIRISNPSASDEDVAAAAAAAAIAHDIEALHGGYNFPVGLRGKFLSGGQRQRIGFARALLRDAPVMLLDEPVAAQDSETLELLAKSVTSLRRRNGDAVTVISSSHSLAFFQHFDHALYVANRTVVEWGSIEELKARRGLLFQLFNAQEGMAVDSSGRVKLDAAKLRTVWLFASVAAEGLAKLASMFTTRKLRAGDVLYGVGDVQDTVYVVVSGRVEMREPPAAGAALGADGKPEKRVLRTLEPGAAFNAESLLHDVIPTHEACAESQTVLCACARVHFEQIMQLSPVVAAAVADMARRHAEYLAPASLRTAWPLCRVSDEDVALLADGAFRVDVVPAQTKLFSAPGSACSSLFVVLHGTVAVAKESGVEHVSAGSLFGATSLLEDINAEARPRLLHATTMDDSVIAVLTAEALAGVMKRTPSVKDAVRGMADAWLAARSATALSRMWLMAPLLAASSSKGDSMQPFRTLSAAVTTRLVGAGLLRDLTPTACVHGKLVATQRPPGVAPELRELQSGEWCAVELVLAGAASWTEEAEAEDSCVVTSLPAGMLSELAADFPGVEDTTLAMLAEYRAGLTSDALKALGLTGIDAEDLEMLPGFCSAHVLTPGKQVFDGRDAQPWIARVLWGDVRGSKGAVLKPGTTFCNQRAASLATGAPADAAAAAGGSDPSRAQLLAETAAPAPARRGSKQPPPRPPPPPPPTAVSMAPKAVVALFDVGALSGKIMEERRRRAAELRAAALARAMQLERIRGMRRDAMVLRLALEQGKLPEATHTADDRAASAGPRRRGLALFRCVAVRIGLACRLRSSATIVGTLDEAEVEAREQLTQVQAEYARRTAERESLVAQLRAAWEELEVAGSPHVPPLAAREFEATNASVTRANMALLHDALDAAQAARDARAAQIASVLDAANVMLADLGPEDDDDDGDDTAQEGHAAAAARLAAAGLQRTVQDEVLALCAALHAERNRRLALQGEARRELAEVREVLAAMRPAYDASDDELARLPTPQPTLVALRAHQEAVMRSRRSMAPDIARARDDLALLWAQLDIPTERRAPLLPAPGEAPSAALLQALQREVRHLNDAADIATHLMSTTPAKPADEPYRTVGGVLVGSVRIGGLRVRESDALLEEAATAQPTVDAIAAALYTRPEMARMRESAAAAEAERAAAAELAATAKLAILQEAAVKQVARSSSSAPPYDDA